MSNITLKPKLTYGFIDRRPDILGNSYTWAWERKPNELLYVVIHHSAGPANQTPDQIAKFHVNSRKWGGVGYHFIIPADGKVHYVGDIGTARANVKDKNEKVIGVCLIGDFTKHLPTDEQIIAAHELCKFLLFDLPAFPKLKGWASLKGHKDLQATACPASSWAGQSGVRDRIVNNIPYTPANQTPTLSAWERLVEYLEINKDPDTTTFEDVQRVIAGFKSRSTDLENQVKQVARELAIANTEIKNKTEQVGRLKKQLLKQAKENKAEIKAIIKAQPNIEKLKGEYDGRIGVLQGEVDNANKRVGSLEIKLTECENGNVELKKVKNAFQTLVSFILKLWKNK